MKKYCGTYRGFSPTDESDCGLGEIEITITETSLSVRMATGIEIIEEDIPTAAFRQLSDEEVSARFNGDSVDTVHFAVFRHSGRSLELLFADPSDEGGVGLVVDLGDTSELFCPTVLFTPTQIERGDFETAVKKIEESHGVGVLPRLNNNGRANKYV